MGKIVRKGITYSGSNGLSQRADYHELINKPSINNVTLDGNKSLSDLGAVPATEKGAANGVATLDTNGKVPVTQIPGSVDEIVEGYYYNSEFYEDSAHTEVITPANDTIYVDLETNNTYRWGGSAYVRLDAGLSLGETASTAYAGNKGKANADNISALQTPTFVEAETRANIATGESYTTILGKIKKFFSDLKTVAFTGSYNDLTNKPEHLGHSIKDSTTTFTDRSNLKFTGNVSVTDSSANDTTEVEILGATDHVYNTKSAMLADLSNVDNGDIMYTLEDADGLVERVEDLEDDVTALNTDKQPKTMSQAIAGQTTVEGALSQINTNLNDIIRKSNFTDRTPDASGVITIPGNYTTANYTLIGANISRTGWCITIAQGTNQWELKITDPDSGAPITGNVSGTAYFVAK